MSFRLDPFFIRASFQRSVTPKEIEETLSRSLLYQGFVSTTSAILRSDMIHVSIPSLSGLRFNTRPGNTWGPVYTSQSLLYQGFVSTEGK